MKIFSELFTQKKETKPVEKNFENPMTIEEVYQVINEYGTGTHPFMLECTDEVHGETKDLVVQWVSYYGMRFESIPELLSAVPVMQNMTIREELQEAHHGFKQARKVMLSKKAPCQKISTFLDGDVYIYEEGEHQLGQALTLILIKTQAGLFIDKGFLTQDGAAYQINFSNPGEAESLFYLLNQNVRYATELAELRAFMERIAHYNQLHNEGRISLHNGKVVIALPNIQTLKGGAAQ